jgi:arsenate reductase
MSAGAPPVQVFGLRKCAATRKALRFFSERRIATHFVDLKERAASPGELRRFAQKFGPEALVDRDSPRFRELGLHVTRLSADRWIERLAAEPLLLVTPLVRSGYGLTIGENETEWKAWAEKLREP